MACQGVMCRARPLQRLREKATKPRTLLMTTCVGETAQPNGYMVTQAQTLPVRHMPLLRDLTNRKKSIEHSNSESQPNPPDNINTSNRTHHAPVPVAYACNHKCIFITVAYLFLRTRYTFQSSLLVWVRVGIHRFTISSLLLKSL